MNPKTKKYLVIGGAVVAVAAIVFFIVRKRKGAGRKPTTAELKSIRPLKGGAIKRPTALKRPIEKQQ